MPGAAEYYERVVAAGAPPKAASNWVQGELRRLMKEHGLESVADVPVTGTALAELVVVADRGVVSSSGAKEVLERMWASGRSAASLIDELGLAQIADEGALTAIVHEVIAAHPDAVAQFRAGKAATFGFLVGQVMKASQGKADPKRVSELMRRFLAT
jgi:aspartyl-tRNA(Asn)/glutamyl-tRNA(Gln) amidotransferase subunit B